MRSIICVVLFIVFPTIALLAAEPDLKDDKDAVIAFQRLNSLLTESLKDKNCEKYVLCFPPEMHSAMEKNRDVIKEYFRDAIVPEKIFLGAEIPKELVGKELGQGRAGAVAKVLQHTESCRYFITKWSLPGNGHVTDVVIYRNGQFFKIAN